jgi:signal transduction histidine kinase
MDAHLSEPSDLVDRRALEEALTFLVQCGAPGTGEDFFQSLARFLAGRLDMDYVCIDRLETGRLSARTVAVYFDGRFEDNISYTLHETPCGEVVGKSICVFPQGVRHLFPNDLVLQQMVAESYAGTTLWSSDGQPNGLIAIIGRKPLQDRALATSLLQLVAVRAAGELERLEAEGALRESEAALQRTNHELLVAGEELALANRELRAANESLEARVRERTADLERRTIQLRALAVQLTRAEEQERRRAAELIHDQLQQLLSAGRIEVELLSRQSHGSETADQARRLDAILAESLAVSRSLTADLSPSVLYRGTFPAAVQWLGRWYEDRHGLAVTVTIEEDVDVEADEVRITLFRSIRELLFNIVKHAKVRSAEVRVGRDDGAVLISVHDHGVGFDAAEARAREGSVGSFGLFSLRERLGAFGGSLDVFSTPGRGSRVVLRAPAGRGVGTVHDHGQSA